MVKELFFPRSFGKSWRPAGHTLEALVHIPPDESNYAEWLEEASFPLYWKKVGDQSNGQYSAPGTTLGENQWEMAFYAEITASDGVLDANQSFANGAIETKGSILDFLGSESD